MYNLIFPFNFDLGEIITLLILFFFCGFVTRVKFRSECHEFEDSSAFLVGIVSGLFLLFGIVMGIVYADSKWWWVIVASVITEMIGFRIALSNNTDINKKTFLVFSGLVLALIIFLVINPDVQELSLLPGSYILGSLIGFFFREKPITKNS